MKRLGLDETVVEVLKRSGLRWMGHVLRREDNEPVITAWDQEVDGIRGKGRSKIILERCGEEDKQ